MVRGSHERHVGMHNRVLIQSMILTQSIRIKQRQLAAPTQIKVQNEYLTSCRMIRNLLESLRTLLIRRYITVNQPCLEVADMFVHLHSRAETQDILLCYRILTVISPKSILREDQVILEQLVSDSFSVLSVLLLPLPTYIFHSISLVCQFCSCQPCINFMKVYFLNDILLSQIIFP